MASTATPRRVLKVPRLDEGAPGLLPAAARPAPVLASAAPPDSHSLLLPFELEGFESTPAMDPVTDSAFKAADSVRRLLAVDDPAVLSAAALAVQAGQGDLQATAQTLARLGFSVRLCTSAGGSLRSLKNSYLMVARNAITPGGRKAEEWVVDPAFAQAFQVTAPTPRYRHVLSAVPPLLVAPLSRLARAMLLLGAELARNFEQQELPLPPWRHVDALLTRYDAASSVEVRANGGLAAPPPAPASAAAAARKQARAQEQLAGVQLRLLRLGVLAPSQAGDEGGPPPSPPTPSPPSPSGAALFAEAGSPQSVVDGARAAAALTAGAFPSGAKPHERVCWGSAHERVCWGQQGPRRQRRRQQAAAAA